MLLKQNKRGFALLEFIFDLIIGAIVVLMLFWAFSFMASCWNGQQLQKEQASARLDEMFNSLDSSNIGDSVLLYLYTPQGWWLSSEGNKICICPDSFGKADCSNEKTVCKELTKPLLKGGLPFIEQIAPKGKYFYLVALNEEKDYNIGGTPVGEYKAYRPSKTQLDEYLQKKYPALAGLGQCILDASASSGVPVEVIIGVAVHESAGGTSGLASGKNPLDGTYAYNLFGIKGTGPAGTSYWVPSAEYSTVGGKPRGGAEFKRYHDQCESVNDFVRIISTLPAYTEAMKYKDDPQQMIFAISGCSGPYAGKPCIYASDANWAEGVIKVAVASNIYLSPATGTAVA
ncbi:hypothetical protein COS75_01985 [Candidatus Pacearchaeota archaeon CG06_land_8_20_14_3_00_35_12]|nr:MAG: hypothetical protein COS75_01985 [Candidatus Pacearchaeota archaeon CG06_land_8_20_14_3_00_35_12]